VLASYSASSRELINKFISLRAWASFDGLFRRAPLFEFDGRVERFVRMR
jgi:hypothetical protein